MKKYTLEQWTVIRNQIQGAARVAGHLAENLENIPFADLRERLENLRDWLDTIDANYQDNAADINTGKPEK